MDEALEFLAWFGVFLTGSAFIAWFILWWLEGDDDDNRR